MGRWLVVGQLGCWWIWLLYKWRLYTWQKHTNFCPKRDWNYRSLKRWDFVMCWSILAPQSAWFSLPHARMKWGWEASKNHCYSTRSPLSQFWKSCDGVSYSQITVTSCLSRSTRKQSYKDRLAKALLPACWNRGQILSSEDPLAVSLLAGSG